jgi:hypothetical protein
MPMDTMGRVGLKKILIFLSLLALLAELGFTQQDVSIQIIGRIPDPKSAELYQFQLGAFSKSLNARVVFTQLRQAGFTPVYEQYQSFTRVLVRGVRARDVRSYLERIKQADFKEVIIREDPGKILSPAFFNAKWEIVSRNSDFDSFEFDEHGNFLAIMNDDARDPAYLGKYTVKSWNTLELEDYGVITLQARMNNTVNFTFAAQESDSPVAYRAKENTSILDDSRQTSLLCRTWRAVALNGDDVQDVGGEHLTFFSKTGAFYVVYLDEDRSALGQWKWKNSTRKEFVYSWDNWKTSGTDRIHTLTDTYWKDEWATNKYDTPPVWESVAD